MNEIMINYLVTHRPVLKWCAKICLAVMRFEFEGPRPTVSDHLPGQAVAE